MNQTKKILCFLAVCVSCSCFFFLQSSLALAETHVSSETLFQNGTVWNKAGSPYILDDGISILQGQSLSIYPGVTVIASSTPDNPISISVAGDFTIAGTPDDPVIIDGLDNITFFHSNVSISHAHISMPDGIDMFYSTSTIASSTISGASDVSSDGADDGGAKAISLWGSRLNVEDSTIAGNDYGIYSYHVSSGVFLSFLGTTAEADPADNPSDNHISISGSTIAGNRTYGIYNATTNVVNAPEDWWGDAAGPRAAVGTTGNYAYDSASDTAHQGDLVYGLVDAIPWLTSNPASSTAATSTLSDRTPCCSNVLFLPGIEGSRLYANARGALSRFVGTSTDRLWEPDDNADAEKLFMDASGKSLDSSVHAKDVIDSAYGVGVYNNFIAMMNGVVADKTINAWEPFAYDWRYGVDSIVGTTSAAGGSTSKLLSDFQSLASSSKTGKVTIVAHSDGGLVAKMLAKALIAKGESNLIDKVIMVAVPELGTPQAVASLLHGDGQGILGGFVLSDATARGLGENSPGAYGLLPSQDYFSQVASAFSSHLSSYFLEPMISFATSTFSDADLHPRTGASDDQNISTYDALRSFLAGISDHRSQPASADTGLPEVLHTSMIDAAQAIHNALDHFSFASSTVLSSLIGVGDQTLAGMRYFEKIACPVTNAYDSIYRPMPCIDSLDYTSTTTPFGDGTVVDASAAAVPDGKDYYLNLYDENKGKLIDDSHATILNTASAVAFVKEQVTASSTSLATSTIPAEALPPYITDTEPTLAELGDENDLIITMHSPVDIDVYDSQGRHTGRIPNPDPASDLIRYETGIPGSKYKESDTQGKSITVPYDTDYRVVLTGTGNGSFTLDTEHDKDWVPVAETEFADMPATPLLKGELLLSTTTYATATSTIGPTKGKLVSVATTSQLLVMDFDGDGIVDATSTPGGTIDPTAYLRSMERTIRSLGLSAYRQKVMCDKIDKMIGYILAKKPIQVDQKSAVLAEQALDDVRNQHWIFKDLDQEKKDRLTNIFQTILDSADI